LYYNIKHGAFLKLIESSTILYCPTLQTPSKHKEEQLPNNNESYPAAQKYTSVLTFEQPWQTGFDKHAKFATK